MQPQLVVSLAALRNNNACFSGYNKVIRMLQKQPFTEKDANRSSYIHFAYEERVALSDILSNNGRDDALWALRCIPNNERNARLFAVWCARQVQHLMSDERSITALDVAEKFANNLATEEERDAAGEAAWVAAGAAAYAAGDAARAAAYAAGKAAYAAAWEAAYAARDAARAAAYAAAWEAANTEQTNMFRKMCAGEAPWQLSSPQELQQTGQRNR